MSTFDLIINLIEGFIMCYFLFQYFHIKDTKKIIICSFLMFFEITMGNIYINESSIQIIILGVTLICISLFLHIKLSIESIVMCISVLLIDLICNMFALSTMPIFKYFLESDKALLIIITIISKILFLLSSLIVPKKRIYFKSKLDNKRWTSMIVIFALLLVDLFILANDYTINHITKTDIFICLVLTSMITVITIYIYLKILEENEEKTRIILKNEEIKYKKENYLILSRMSDDLYRLQHNLRYILMKIKYSINDQEYDKCIEFIDNYVKKFNRFKTIINTENPYFDYFLNKKLSDLYLNDKDVNVSISISRSDYYLNKDYINFITLIIDNVINRVEKITINIYEINENNIIEIIVPNSISEFDLENCIQGYTNILNANYKIINNDELLVFKSIQRMN